MTPYLLVFFILAGDFPTQEVKAVVGGICRSEEACSQATYKVVEGLMAKGTDIENVNGVCVPSGFEIGEV